jgi:hypothetical protein
VDEEEDFQQEEVGAVEVVMVVVVDGTYTM